MKVNEIMTSDVTCCTQDDTIKDAARMMRDEDCGAIPVVESQSNPRMIGVITDRDIAVRGVAEGKDPNTCTCGECMTNNVVTISEEASVDECARLMEQHRVRRIFVADGNNCCCGVVAQADIAINASDKVAEMVQEVSMPSHGAQML